MLREGFEVFPSDADQTDDLLDRISFSHGTDARLLNTGNQAVLRFSTGAASDEALVGIDCLRYEIDQVQASGSAPAPRTARSGPHGRGSTLLRTRRR